LELYNKSMPKAVDIYVLETKIGSGQFGDVYRGYSKVDGVDVAVKTIKRDKIKGTHEGMQASSRNYCRMRSRCLRAARTTTSCD
jgi:serine/threonine protein kinase